MTRCREPYPGSTELWLDRIHPIARSMANSVPEGQSAEKFFDESYGEKLAKRHAYPWFQAQMIAVVNAEKPPPSFAEALRQVGN